MTSRGSYHDCHYISASLFYHKTIFYGSWRRFLLVEAAAPSDLGTAYKLSFLLNYNATQQECLSVHDTAVTLLQLQHCKCINIRDETDIRPLFSADHYELGQHVWCWLYTDLCSWHRWKSARESAENHQSWRRNKVNAISVGLLIELGPVAPSILKLSSP